MRVGSSAWTSLRTSCLRPTKPVSAIPGPGPPCADVEIFMVLKPDIACLWFASSSLQVRQITAEEVARRNQDLYDASYKEVFANQKSVLDALSA